ncbi:hypothetical protein CRE_09492 [Caenorhabditis remanei]|uniref:Uncharacterized protein n=1 Tax=Caenorhabditis remanei TaxID=31234 RepID=E3MJ52_CAERE|nr:hypothetical protein CRE_09492 [Caenorhabditis remanei]
MPHRKTFKQCQFEYNGREMQHFRSVDEYCTWMSHLKIALLIPMFIMAVSGQCQKNKENKIYNKVYIYAMVLFVAGQFWSALFSTYIWRSVSRYKGANERKMYVVPIISYQLLSIVCLSVAVYQYFTLPSEKYIKNKSAFFYCIGYEVLAIIADVIYLKFLINYCKELLNYCEQEDAVMDSNELFFY